MGGGGGSRISARVGGFLVGFALVGGVLWALLTAETIPDSIEPGYPAPAFSLPVLGSGEPLSLESLRGKVVLLNFWATWCKPCEDEMPAMESLYRMLGSQGFELVAVSVDDDPQRVEEFTARLGLTFPVLLDPELGCARLSRPDPATAGDAGAGGMTTPGDAGRLHPVLTWRSAVLGSVVVLALAGVAAAGWLLLGGESARPPHPIRSIAVLPLENLSNEPEEQYFALGITEALIGEVAKLGSLIVISPSSVMHYAAERKPLVEIASELDVDGIVEGSVLLVGDRVRIAVDLFDRRSGRYLWGERYDRELSEVVILQQEVTRAVAEQIRLELTPEERAALTAFRTVDPDAYDAYLRGRLLQRYSAFGQAFASQAIEQFERALELDPGFAEAWAALAAVRVELGATGFDPRHRGEFAKAREAAQRALELDERLGEAHEVLGNVRLWHDWDFPGARQAFERALQLGSSRPGVLEAYAWLLLLAGGETERALDLSERLVRVAPFPLYYRGRRVKHLVFARQYQRALEEAEKVRELHPEFLSLDVFWAYRGLGRLEDAHRTLMTQYERCGVSCDRFREARERGWAEDGWEGSFRAWLEVATDTEGYSPWLIALGCAEIEEVDEAFAWLERGYRDRDPPMINLKAHPGVDALRSDPRFQDLLGRIGFPEE
jgi:TolB-like protein/thiol-disulfide isomerase/thioredoxin/Tfp pilus assembly protein PilF